MSRFRLACCVPVAVAVLSLCACASNDASLFGSAATAPLSDLNIVRTEIPPILELARANPYVLPFDRRCLTLLREVDQLDKVLGPDIDLPANDSAAGLVDRGTDAIENSAADALQNTAEGFIPFRSWIRKLTGAEEHARQVSAAVSAGIVRRAFLKGIGATEDCHWNMSIPEGTTTGAITGH